MEPYKIYDFEDEKAWLKGRLNGIGGSDASAVVGKNPWHWRETHKLRSL